MVAKLSGYVYVSINFRTEKISANTSAWNYVVFVISLILSLLACTQTTYFPVANVTHSQILEIGVNLTTKALLFGICVIKSAIILQKEKFITILSNLQNFNEQVSEYEFKI